VCGNRWFRRAAEGGTRLDQFPDFYRKHYRLILTVAQQRLGGTADAEDVTAEVFRVAWARHDDGAAITLPWLYTTLRNVIGNEYRRQGRLGSFVSDAGPILTVDDSFGSAADDAIEVRRALRRLPEADRELLYMAYWEELSRVEIAAILGISAIAVRIRLMRARERFRHLLPREQDIHDEEAISDGRV